MPHYPDFETFCRLAQGAELGARLPPAGERLAHAGLGLSQDRRRAVRVPVRERGRRREGGPLQLPGHRAVLRDRGLRQPGDDHDSAYRGVSAARRRRSRWSREQFESPDPLEELRRRVEAVRAVTLPELPPFCQRRGRLRRLRHGPLLRAPAQRPARRPPGARPGLRLLRPDGRLRQRHQDDRRWWRWPGSTSRASTAGAAYDERLPPRRRTWSSSCPRRPCDLRPVDIRTRRRRRRLPYRSNFTQAEFEAAVGKCVEYIRAGDIFQVVLSQRLEVPIHGAPVRDLPHAAGGQSQPVHVLRAHAAA